jgi:hypothetical protein
MAASQSKFFYEKGIFLSVHACCCCSNFNSNLFSKEKSTPAASAENQFYDCGKAHTTATAATSSENVIQ